MSDREEEHKSQSRIRRQLSLIGPRFLLTTPILCQYAPGDTFWDFVLPGEASEFEADSFEAVYLGDIPKHYSTTIDSILIDWLTQKAEPTAAVKRMKTVIDELKSLRPQGYESAGGDDEIDLLPNLVTSLTELTNGILPHEEKRATLAALISVFRDRYFNSGFGSGDRPLGRG